MKWNYRVMVKENGSEPLFEIHEVYYEDNIPISYTENASQINSFYLDGLRWDLEKMIESLDKPILHYGDRFPEEYLVE